MFARKFLLIDVALIVALLTVGALGYRLSPLLLPPVDIGAVPDPGCDLQRGPCGAELPQGGRLRFAMRPYPVPQVEPMQLEVEIERGDVDKVVVDFTGVNMNMGFNRQELGKLGAGHFSGQAVLPVCVTGRMSWLATVIVERGRTRIAIPFRFEAGH